MKDYFSVEIETHLLFLDEFCLLDREGLGEKAWQAYQWKEMEDNKFLVSKELFPKEQEKYLLLVAREKEGELIGFLLAEVSKLELSAHLLKLVVSMNFRRKGVGKRLLTDFFTSLKRSSFEKIFLEVLASNLSAIELYKQNGLIPLHLAKNYYGEGKDCLKMGRNLLIYSSSEKGFR